MLWQDNSEVPNEIRMQKLTLKMLGDRKGYSLQDFLSSRAHREGGWGGVLASVHIPARPSLNHKPVSPRKSHETTQEPNHPGGGLSLKAAEVGFMLPFVVESLSKHGGGMCSELLCYTLALPWRLF